MKKIYLLGGEDYNKRSSEKIERKAILDVGESPIVLLFPWSGWFTTEKRNKYIRLITEYLMDIGASEVIYARVSEPLKSIKEKIENSNLIHLPGGSDELLLKRMKRKRIDQLLREYKGVIVGNSAGALILCNKYAVVKNQDNEPVTKLKNGLGLLDFTIHVHYTSKYDEELKMLSLSTKTSIYAIPEGNALVFDGKNLHNIGDVYVFEIGKKKRFLED
jgi:peptidase E